MSGQGAADTVASLIGWRERGEHPDAGLARQVLRDLAARHPGRSVELRVPPLAAVQIVAGPPHRRGTPKAVVETDPDTLLALCAGTVTWAQAVAAGRVWASGERSDLSALFPITDRPGPDDRPSQLP